MTNAFDTLEMRVGRIMRVEPNAAARKPSYKMWIDFGPLGEKTSSGQFTTLYAPENLVGRLVVCTINLGTRSIAGFPSEVLVMGANDAEGNVVLLSVERDVAPGERVY